MTVKITYNEENKSITVEPAKQAEVIHFTPRIIQRMISAGKNIVLQTQPRKF